MRELSEDRDMLMSSVFITGARFGIGHALAEEYLRRGWRVYGVSGDYADIRKLPGE